MTSNLPKSVLAQTLSDVLSDLAFLFHDDGAQLVSALGRLHLQATIRYEGAVCGELCVEADESFAELLAANMLGAANDGPRTERRTADALSEFVNVLCGQFVTALHGDEDVFDFSIPVVRFVDESVQSEAADACVIESTVSGCRLRVRYAALESPLP